MTMHALLTSPVVHVCLWSAVTIAVYLVAKFSYRRWHRWWQAPLVLAPILLIGIVLLFHISYKEYYQSAGWLVLMLGPATVAFAIPIYEQRAVIKRNWALLLVGMLVGTTTAILTSWAMASALGIDGALRLSLLPRSISTPFAMDVSRNIGGIADLTAVFVILTGIFGSVLGEVMVGLLPLKSAMSRGAMLGVAAHAAGTAKAHELGAEEGSIAGLLMILVGVLNVAGASVFACLQ